MNTAYSFKNSKYSVEDFLKITLFNGRHMLEIYEEKHLLSIDKDNNILFSKERAQNHINVKILKK